jgi:nucleotide-binding universal stress UspA family protein
MTVIVVGVDGSPHAAAALRWAVDEAEQHGAIVRAVMAWNYLDQHHPDPTLELDRSHGEAAAAEALRTAVAGVPSPRPIEQRVVCDLPGRALLDAGEDADLLVVGARGAGGFRDLLLGSVSERVVEHAHLPVAVVRQGAERPASGPVVVGVDGSMASVEALRWAAAEARARRAALEVVHVWQVPSCGAPPVPSVLTSIEEAARRTLDEALTDPALDGGDVGGHLACGGPARRLMDVARDASLLVVGTRGRGALGRIVLGSTSRQLAHHAPCPLVVVPPSARRPRLPRPSTPGEPADR